MAIAKVQDVVASYASSASAASHVLTVANSVGSETTGNLLILRCFSSNTGRTLGVTDDGGNTWVVHRTGSATAPVTYTASAKITTPLTNGQTITITWTGGSATTGAKVIEVSGQDGTTPYDQGADATGTSTAADSGATGTLAQADNLVVGQVATSSTSTQTWETTSPTWTDEGGVTTSGTIRESHFAQKVVSATTALNAKTTLGTSRTWHAQIDVFKAAAGASPQTVTLGVITQTAVINSINVQSLFVTLGFINQGSSVFAPTLSLRFDLGLIDQTAVIFAPAIGTSGAQTVTLGFLNQTAVINALTRVATVQNVTLGLITITPIAYAPSLTTTFSFPLGFINATASIFTPIVNLGAAPFVPGVPRNRSGAIEYVVEFYDSGATFGPNTKLGEFWDARNLGWSKYDRLPGKGFITLAQTSAMLANVVPLTTHVAIYRCSNVADVLVYRGVIYDYDSTGDDVILECFDYIALLALSRAGFKTMYPTKAIGSEIATPEWAAAKSATSSPLGFVTTGTVQDPLGTDGSTVIKTNAQWGTLDQLRLQLMYDLTEMGRANTVNQTTFEIDLTNTFNFWKNQNGTASSALVLGGNVSDYNYLPNWKKYRNNLATLGVAANGGPSEIVSTNAGEITAKGLRQDVATLKTLAGIAGLATEADQQKAALDRQLKHLTQQESTLMLRLLRERFTPYTDGWINDQIAVELSNGIDSISANRRIIGMQARYSEYGEDLNLILQGIAT